MKEINFEVFETISLDNAKVFVDTYLPSALTVEKKTGLNHIVILAQAALESAWGLKAVGNNFFGIKWTGKGDKQLITTT
ncbi:MAG: glucosaminidase domain-containing protein, partial [Flavobacterium sp.]